MSSGNFFGGRDPFSFDFFEDPFEDFLGTEGVPEEAEAEAQAHFSLPSVGFHPSEVDFLLLIQDLLRLGPWVMEALLHSLPRHSVVVGWATSSLYQLLLK